VGGGKKKNRTKAYLDLWEKKKVRTLHCEAGDVFGRLREKVGFSSFPPPPGGGGGGKKKKNKVGDPMKKFPWI